MYAEFASMPWRRFESLVFGLMQSDSRIGRFFAPAPPPRPSAPRSY